jgi:hypothetical protein
MRARISERGRKFGDKVFAEHSGTITYKIWKTPAFFKMILAHQNFYQILLAIVMGIEARLQNCEKDS